MRRTTRLLSIILLTTTALLLSGLADLTHWLQAQDAINRRGTGYGLSALVDNPLANVNAYGVNVYLDDHSPEEVARSLSLIQAAGLRWVRLHLSWASVEAKPNVLNWSPWDDWLDLSQQHGLQVILVVTGTPQWARRDPLLTAPPADPQTYAAFLAAAVRHYQGRVRYFQVWDDPNIAPYWGSGNVSPTAYTKLLQAAYTAAKKVDPACVILSAGLAPNWETWETGGKNLNELDFLRGMYRAGAQGSFDVLGAKPYGFWETPDDHRFDPAVMNFSRLALQREIMEEFGDRDTPVWVVAFGWNALPADWAGRPSVWGSDDQDLQAQRTVVAMQRARQEWPWLGVMTLACFRWAGDPANPIRGFALVGADFAPRRLYAAVSTALHEPAVAPPGIYEPTNPACTWAPGWWMEKDADRGIVAAGSDGLTCTVRFWGTRLDAGSQGATLQIALDDGLPTTKELDRSGNWRFESLVSDVPEATHRVDVRATSGHVRIDAWRVVREKPLPPYEPVIMLLLAALAVNLLWLLRRLTQTRLAAVRWATQHPRATDRVILAAMLLALAWYQWLPGDVMALLGLGALLLLAAWRPAPLLGLVALTAPFYLSLWRFASVTETLVLVGAVAWVLRTGWTHDWRALWPRRTDLPVLLF
ncbi:MAG: hypothetical protein KJ734_08725, partial [Chloroflexi bacterium]|nr:hypothetical protein [Chloroflexota bacterium]